MLILQFDKKTLNALNNQYIVTTSTNPFSETYEDAEKLHSSIMNQIIAGNFDASVVFPSPDGNKIITLSAPYQGKSKNLYAVLVR
jgi:hypothetical protein